MTKKVEYTKDQLHEFLRDTALAPFVVGEIVFLKHYDHLEKAGVQILTYEQAERYTTVLATKAITVYFRNKEFAAKLKSRKGREYIYGFMHHWMSAMVKERSGKAFDALTHELKGLSR